ncbi:MAG TPA: ABC transporter permease, partial [Gemmatimonadales bacterium]
MTPGYFAALGIPLTRGRDFSGLDRQDTPPVAIISEAMAARFWPDRDPVGARFRQGETGPEATVIGVAGPARHRDLTTDLFAPSSEPDVYYPFAQRTATDLEIAVRMRDGSLLSTPRLQREVA